VLKYTQKRCRDIQMHFKILILTLHDDDVVATVQRDRLTFSPKVFFFFFFFLLF
jgi:hypothetical protein